MVLEALGDWSINLSDLDLQTIVRGVEHEQEKLIERLTPRKNSLDFLIKEEIDEDKAVALKETAEKTPDVQMIIEDQSVNCSNFQMILPNLVFKTPKQEPKLILPMIEEEDEDSEQTPWKEIIDLEADSEERWSHHSSEGSLYAYDPILIEGQVLWKLTEKNKELIRYVLEKFIGDRYKFLLN